MLIVVGFSLSPHLETLLLSDNVNYRPDLEFKGESAVEGMLELVAPDVFVSRSVPGRKALELWRESADSNQRLLLICLSEETASDSIADVTVQWLPPNGSEPEIEAFKAAERFCRPQPLPA